MCMCSSSNLTLTQLLPVQDDVISDSYNLYDLCMFDAPTNFFSPFLSEVAVGHRGQLSGIMISLPAWMYHYGASRFE